MAKDHIDKLEQKKQELKKELENIQNELDDSIEGVRNDVSSRLDPTEFIKKHPLPTVGLSILVGFLAGHKKTQVPTGSDSGPSMTALLWNEIKKIGTRKAVSFITDYTEKILMDKREQIISEELGKENGNGRVKKD